MATQSTEVNQAIEKIVAAIATLQPISPADQTKELHLAMIDLFDVLDLKSGIEQKIMENVKQKSGTSRVKDIKPIPATELPDSLPRIRGPADYFLLTLDDQSVRHAAVTTSGPYVIIGENMPRNEPSSKASVASTTPITTPPAATSGSCNVPTMNGYPIVTGNNSGQQPLFIKAPVTQQGPIVGKNPNTADSFKPVTSPATTNVTNNATTMK